MTLPDVDASAVLAHVRDSRSEIITQLAEWVRMESPSDRPETQEPLLAALAEAFQAVGYRTLHCPSVETGGQLYARPERRAPRQPAQLLLGHCDTVWPVGTLETMPVSVEDDGTMRGPGIYDMKGGLVQMVFALRTLQALDIEPAVTPVVFINSDEEIGSPASRPRIRRLARVVDRVFVLEPSLGRDGKLKTARKGIGRFAVEVTGKSSHAGLDPGGGASAIQELSHVIQKLHALSDPEKGRSVNVGQIEGGQRPNVVAPSSRAVVDVRVRTQEDAEWMTRRIRNLEPSTPGVTLHIDGHFGRPPMERTPRNRMLWHLAQEAAERLGLVLDEGRAGGASDGNETSPFTATLDGLGPVGDGAHAAHEFVFIDRLLERTALLALLLLAAPLGTPSTGHTASQASQAPLSNPTNS